MLATGANGLRPLRATPDEHCSAQRHPGRSNLYFAGYGEGPVRVGSSISHGVERRFAGSSRGETRGQAPREKSDKGRGTRIARFVPCHRVISATTGDLYD
jgi:hypothetical protein